MKTSEFKKTVKELGFRVVEGNPDGISVRTIHSELIKAIVSKVLEDTLMLNTTSIKLMKLCIEYAETPIEEREEEKKYTVVLPDPEFTGSARMILSRAYGEKIILLVSHEERVGCLESQRLTESEIKRNHEYLWQFAKEVKE